MREITAKDPASSIRALTHQPQSIVFLNHLSGLHLNGSKAKTEDHIEHRCHAQEHPFTITDWRTWRNILHNLPKHKQTAAEAVGVADLYITKRLSGGPIDQALTAVHERFAAACCMEELSSGDGSVKPYWTEPDGLVLKGEGLSFMWLLLDPEQGCNV